MKKTLSAIAAFLLIITLTTSSKSISTTIESPAKRHCVTANTPVLVIPSVPEEDETAERNQLAQNLKDFAAKYLGTRYVWGATGPKSFDCSGFTSYVFKNNGINLLRTSSAQYTQGIKVAKNEWQPGDLLFFSSRRSGKGRVGHVAMVTEVNPDGSCVFIHASTKRGVVYQKFPDGGYYSRNYIGAKRVLGNA